MRALCGYHLKSVLELSIRGSKRATSRKESSITGGNREGGTAASPTRKRPPHNSAREKPSTP